ncbi:hypothetical protein TIFTF001_041797 [Ficus carica]|uniref:Uncharacterized protein n=1 Tax=Ficus carica TaxID=3494 RepID=A0AA87Z9J1_FICCA|nr:hypothetical protein TIFTF001_041794 [Ficus carica]GMN32849.1 hypothetical protein TIFTF001_041797 [Ficus carica]
MAAWANGGASNGQSRGRTAELGCAGERGAGLSRRTAALGCADERRRWAVRRTAGLVVTANGGAGWEKWRWLGDFSRPSTIERTICWET